MSYGRLNKPRFYVDAVNWRNSRGVWTKESNLGFTVDGDTWDFAAGSNIYQLFDLNPLNTATITCTGEAEECVIQIDWGSGVTSNNPITFIALLNHNLESASAQVYLQSDTSPITNYDNGENQALTPLLGCEASPDNGVYAEAAGDGDLIATCTATNERYNGIVIMPIAAGNFAANLTIGSILIGTHYTLPNSGDLDVRRSIDFDGVRVRETDAGKRYSHASWICGNDGGHYAPFRVQTNFRRPAGRQAYDVNFSYIADSDLFPDDLSDNGTETDFFYNVHNKTAGPHLPFIWTSDSTSATVGDYLFARIVSDFAPQQIANQAYSMKIRIEEEL